MQGSFGRVVRFTPATQAQLDYQCDNKNGYRTGVAVRLWSKAMADDFYTPYKSPIKYIRVWMEAEYDVITPKEANKLKKQWSES